ncbi:MAG: MerR family transcriptional regulator [Gammaproteobacteria bacterium]
MYTRTFIARIINVHPNTIARWEARGVIEAAQRDSAGRRIYTNDDLANLRELVGTLRPGRPACQGCGARAPRR